MKLVDWRDVPARTLAPLYEAERGRAIQVLQWDTAPAWAEVEQARVTWGLPGLLALDAAGRVHGLAFYVPDGDRLDVGGIVADHVMATDALLDGLLEAADGFEVRTVRAMVFEGAVALQSGLRIRGFDIDPQLYLSRPLPQTVRGSRTDRILPGIGVDAARPRRFEDPRGQPFDVWRDSDIEPAAALLKRAYGRAGSLFAPHDEPAEWERYVRNLVMHVGCGTLNRDATCVLREDGEIRAIALMTDIGPGVAHLVQLAVDPRNRGRGLGSALVGEACARVAGRDCRAVTLLVSAAHASARALYDAAGFRHDATFVAATLQRSRSPQRTGRTVLSEQAGGLGLG